MNFKDYFTEKTLQRGEKYYKDGKVQLVYQDFSTLKTIVNGIDKYVCEIVIRNNQLFSARCSCPYIKGHCKHIAASLFLYEHLNSSQKKSTFATVFEGLKLRFQKQAFTNVSLQIAYSNLEYVDNNIKGLADINVVKTLLYVISNQLNYLEKRDKEMFINRFVEYVNKSNFSNKIISSLATEIMQNNRLLFENVYYLIECFVLNKNTSIFFQEAIRSYYLSNGSDYFFNRVINNLLTNNAPLDENFCLSLLAQISIENFNIHQLLKVSLTNNYHSVIKKISIAYRDSLSEKELLEIFSYLKNVDVPQAKIFGEYLIKNSSNFNIYLNYRSLFGEEEIKNKLPSLIQVAKNNKYEAVFSIYENLSVKKADLIKIKVDDLQYVLDKIKPELKSAIVELLNFKIDAQIKKESIDQTTFTSLYYLYVLEFEVFKTIIKLPSFLSLIDNSTQRIQFLSLLEKTNMLNDFGVYHYEVKQYV